MAAAGLMLLAAVWGAVFLLKPQEAPVKLEVISLSGEDGEADPVLLPGELAQGGVAFRNSGQAGCSLRIRLCTAQLGGKPVLEAGNLEGTSWKQASKGKRARTAGFAGGSTCATKITARRTFFCLEGKRLPPTLPSG